MKGLRRCLPQNFGFPFTRHRRDATQPEYTSPDGPDEKETTLPALRVPAGTGSVELKHPVLPWHPVATGPLQQSRGRQAFEPLLPQQVTLWMNHIFSPEEHLLPETVCEIAHQPGEPGSGEGADTRHKMHLICIFIYRKCIALNFTISPRHHLRQALMASMRILIYAMGSAGDVHPFTGLGKALQARGHEVFLITSAYFEDLVRRSGLNFRPLGTVEDFQRVQSDPDLWHPRRAFGAVIKHAVNASYEMILEHARDLRLPGETVIIASSLAFGALTVRELLGIPVASVHLAPSLFVSTYRQPVLHGAPFGQGAPRFLKALQWWVGGKVVDAHLLPGLNAFRATHGLPPVKNMLRGWHSPDRVIALFPKWFGPPQPDWPVQTRLTGFPLFDEKGLHPLPADLESFIDDGEPPVIFTPGSAMISGHAFFEESVKALKLMNRRGILLTRFPDSIPRNLPPGIRHFSYIPFSQILPRAAALVYHGGVGTCAQTLQAGIPHFLQPMAHDQLDTLSRVRDLGVGDGLHPHQFKAQRIAERLEPLLSDPSVKKRAQEIATRFTPEAWMRESCELVEALLT